MEPLLIFFSFFILLGCTSTCGMLLTTLHFLVSVPSYILVLRIWLNYTFKLRHHSYLLSVGVLTLINEIIKFLYNIVILCIHSNKSHTSFKFKSGLFQESENKKMIKKIQTNINHLLSN